MGRGVLTDSRRIVVKVGSSLLIDEDGRLDTGWLEGLVDDIAGLHGRGRAMLVVSSGAIALGSGMLGIDRRRARLESLQAAAAAGQVRLAHAYREAFSVHGISSAQILLTLEDTEARRRFLNARATLGELLRHSAIPVINENDTVATDEIRYGDNDRLAARVAQLAMADCLLLLSDVDGFYTSDPRQDEEAEHIGVVERISAEMQRMAGATRSDYGSGGMATKLEAARIATRAGCTTVLASGAVRRPISALAQGARCTVFRPQGTPAAARKQWLAGVRNTRGKLVVDAGAAAALADGGSLLPVGVVEVQGSFGRGDVVAILVAGGVELGRGLAEYGSGEAEGIRGCRSELIEARLGYRGPAVMIHRDDMVLFADND